MKFMINFTEIYPIAVRRIGLDCRAKDDFVSGNYKLGKIKVTH